MKGASLIAPLGVRIPDELKEKIQEQAKRNGRSMNAEIVHILEAAFSKKDDMEMASLNMQLHQYASLSEAKDQIMESQKRTIMQMEKSIYHLENHIKTLENHIDFYQKHNKKPT